MDAMPVHHRALSILAAISLLAAARLALFSQESARLTEGFSAPTLSKAWASPELVYDNRGLPAVEVRGALAILPGPATRAASFFMLQEFQIIHSKASLRPGQALAATVWFPPKDAAGGGGGTLRAGITVRESRRRLPGRLNSLVIYLSDEGRIGWRYVNSFHEDVESEADAVVPAGTRVRLCVEKRQSKQFWLGYRIGEGPFVRIEAPVQVLDTPLWTLDPDLGDTLGLYLRRDGRFKDPKGQAMFDDFQVLEASPLPPVRLRAVAEPRLYAEEGEEILFNGTRSSGPVTAFEWDFGDGARAGGSVAGHAYRKAGSYAARLTVRDGAGRRESAAVEVSIDPARPAGTPFPFRCLLLPDIGWAFANPDAAASAVGQAARQGFNVVCLENPNKYGNPFHLLVDVPGFPEAGRIISPGAREANRNVLRRLLSAAGQAGVRLDMIARCINLPDPVCETHGLPIIGDNELDDLGLSDSPIPAAYQSAALGEFYRVFPEFGALWLTVGERPINTVKFARQGYIEPLSRLPKAPPLILRDQVVYPWEMKTLMEGYPGEWVVLSKLSEEQWAYPGAMIRGTLYRRMTGRPVVYLVQSQREETTFVGSHRFVHEIIRDLRGKRAHGFVAPKAEQAMNWMREEAFIRYGADPGIDPDREDEHYAGRLRERYGAGVPAEAYLEGAEACARIIPEIRAQFFYRNVSYKAQYGLPLIAMLAMPTISGFRHYGSFMYDRERRLSWWVPPEDALATRYMSIPEAVRSAGSAAGSRAMTPLRVAREIEGRARRIDRALEGLRAYTPEYRAAEYSQTCAMMEFSAAMARHFAEKIRSAVALERWRAGKLQKAEAGPQILAPLEASIGPFARAVDIFESVYGAGKPDEVRLPYYPQRLPWAFLDSFTEPVPGGMRGVLAYFKSELEAMRGRVAAGDAHPPGYPAETLRAQRGP